MKALSLKQPFAELILQGKKKVELRKWNTRFRGEFLIHSSKVPDSNAMKKFKFGKLPCGCIVGRAKLAGVKHYLNEKEHKEDKERHLADSYWGDYGFIIEGAERFKEPIPAKGKLGFWDFKNL